MPKRLGNPGNPGKSDPKKFFGVVYTHFDAFRAAIQKMKKNLHRALRGRLPPGALAILGLSDFQRPGNPGNPGKSNLQKKKFFLGCIYSF